MNHDSLIQPLFSDLIDFGNLRQKFLIPPLRQIKKRLIGKAASKKRSRKDTGNGNNDSC